MLGLGIWTGEGTEGVCGPGIVAGAGTQPDKYTAAGTHRVESRRLTMLFCINLLGDRSIHNWALSSQSNSLAATYAITNIKPVC